MKKQFIIPVQRLNKKRETVTHFKCLYCSREYDKEEKAEKCVDEHELVLVPISKKDLNRLSQFLYLKNDKLLTQSLFNIINKYARVSALK